MGPMRPIIKILRIYLITLAAFEAFVLSVLGFFGAETHWLGLFALSGPIGMAITIGLAMFLANMVFLAYRAWLVTLPISERTLAWLPLVLAGMIASAGLAGLACGQAIVELCGMGDVAWGHFWTQAVVNLPLVLFTALLIQRGSHQTVVWFIFPFLLVISFFTMLGFSEIRSEMNIGPIAGLQFDAINCLENFLHSYPRWRAFLWLLVVLFFIEMPCRISALGRGLADHGWATSDRPVELHPPYRPRLITGICDTITNALCFVLGGVLLIMLLSGMLYVLKTGAPVMVCLYGLPLLLGFGLIFQLLRTWLSFCAAMASGFRLPAAVAMGILASSYVFAPLAYVCGMKRGRALRCMSCRKWRFVWMPDCPHCAASLAISGKAPTACAPKAGKSTKGRAKRRKYRWLKLFTRLHRNCPPRVTFFILSVVFITQPLFHEPFTRQIYAIDLSQVTDEQEGLLAISAIRRGIEACNSPAYWLGVETPETLFVPKRYRIAAARRNDQVVIESYSLRWDPANGLAETLARQATAMLPAEYRVRAMERGYQIWRPTRMELLLSDQLDNRAHWLPVEDNPAP